MNSHEIHSQSHKTHKSSQTCYIKSAASRPSVTPAAWWQPDLWISHFLYRSENRLDEHCRKRGAAADGPSAQDARLFCICN